MSNKIIPTSSISSGSGILVAKWVTIFMIVFGIPFSLWLVVKENESMRNESIIINSNEYAEQAALRYIQGAYQEGQTDEQLKQMAEQAYRFGNIMLEVKNKNITINN